VLLDGIKFVPMPSGASQAYESLKAKTVDVAYFRDAKVGAETDEAGYAGSTTVMNFGSILLVNNGLAVSCSGGQPSPACDGKADGTSVSVETPGKDPKIREAIQLAVDPAVVNERANDGEAIMAMFDPSFPWDPGVDLPEPNADRARMLVQEAKAAGWDGKIRLTCATDSSARDVGLAVETMLRAVGFDVQPKANLDTRAVVSDVIIKRDYDIACWGLTVSPDDGAQAQLDSLLRSTSPSNRTGFKDPEMDAVLDDLKVATTDDERTDAYRQIAELWIEGVPAVNLGALPERIAWNDNVHGLRSISSGAVVFDEAWIGS
jgi:peptide/nickel transport system substrate-binding protein